MVEDCARRNRRQDVSVDRSGVCGVSELDRGIGSAVSGRGLVVVDQAAERYFVAHVVMRV
jgi:hypothetical protein